VSDIHKEESMSGGTAFRKDCEGCGHSFLTPDRKAKLCPRCIGKNRNPERPEKPRPREHPSKTAAASKDPGGKQLPKTSGHKPTLGDSKKAETMETRNTPPESKAPGEGTGKPEPGQTSAGHGPETKKQEIVLTEEQIQEIIKRYQAYVEVMERPANGRRKTIAAEIGLPYRAIVMALRNWNLARERDLSREDRFLVEKAYFSFLKKENSFAQIKERICRETGLAPWSVSRYLDILHDGENKLKEVPDVSLKQRTAILAEYENYLAGSSPPGPFLHPMIAEKTGITGKQVHKVLLAYRLDRFRERWS
jgi:hypothetical protein